MSGSAVPADEPIALGPAQHWLQRAEQRPSLEPGTVGVAPALDSEQPPDDLRQSIALQRPVLVQHLLDEQPRIALEAVAAEVVVEQLHERLRIGEQLAPARGRQQRLALAAHQSQPPQRRVHLREHRQIALAVRRAEQLVPPPVRPAFRRLPDDRSPERVGLGQPEPVHAALQQPAHHGGRLVDLGTCVRHGARPKDLG